MPKLHTLGLTITLPEGWSHKREPGAPLTLEVEGDDTWGVLQISRLADEHLAFIRDAPDLGHVAAQIGQGLGDGWGMASATKELDGKLGKLGLATFPQGQYPVMMLFVGVTEDCAYLLTWLGSEINREALAIVMTAERAHSSD